jgi:hypothetical protein
LGIEHVNELMVRLAMTLLRDGHRLAFGGTLGNAAQELTKHLIEVATNWMAQETAQHCDVTAPETWPLVNYSAWPYSVLISEEQKARLVGICRFVTIDPPGASTADLTTLAENWRKSPQARLLTANALSAMRERSTLETDMRIVWSGRIAGADGWMAGILEEVGFSLKHGKPVLILGGFGGCARLLADFLADSNAPWPAQLTLDASADAQRDAVLSNADRQALNERFEEIQNDLSKYRQQLHSRKVVNQIPTEDLRTSLTTETSREAIRFASAAARACAPKSGNR